MRWNWGAGSGRTDGRVVGIKVGGRWTDGTGSVENALLVDGHLTKISEELVWDYDPEDWMSPWRVTGESVDLTLTPFHLKHSVTDLQGLRLPDPPVLRALVRPGPRRQRRQDQGRGRRRLGGGTSTTAGDGRVPRSGDDRDRPVPLGSREGRQSRHAGVADRPVVEEAEVDLQNVAVVAGFALIVTDYVVKFTGRRRAARQPQTVVGDGLADPRSW